MTETETGETEPRDGEVLPALRDDKGRFKPGHAAPGPGRPPGAVNVLTKSLREQVLGGMGDVETFVARLCAQNPAAAAGLLARMLPPAEVEPPAEVGTVEVTVVAVPQAWQFSKLPDGREVLIRAEAAEADCRAEQAEHVAIRTEVDHAAAAAREAVAREAERRQAEADEAHAARMERLTGIKRPKPPPEEPRENVGVEIVQLGPRRRPWSPFDD